MTEKLFETETFIADGAGWDLSLKRVCTTTPVHSPAVPRGRPVLIVPGYGMNSFIFGFHPNGLSMEEHLAATGLEVFSVDLRGQGRAVARSDASSDWGLGELAIDDLSVAIARVLELTRTGADRVDLVGVSLGASLVFAHLACIPNAPVKCVVSMGGVVTWVKIHPLVRIVFGSPTLVSRFKLRNTREIVRRLLPIMAARAPRALSVYIHAQSTDLSHADTMSKTVEDPHPRVNKQIAMWLKNRELVVRGVNVSRAVPAMKYPLLTFVAKDDGIVPPETARWIDETIGSSDHTVIEVGLPDIPIAHADLFVSRISHDHVFTPLAAFLGSR